MSNYPPNGGQVNQPGSPYSSYGSNQPGPFNSRYGAPGQHQPQPVDPKQLEMQEFINYKFSPEELGVIKQCEIDSLFKRSIPIGFGLGFGTFLGTQKGIFKASPRFGAWPKIIGASLLGYMIGRFSYMKTCQEKIMELPNSRLADMLRRRSRKYNPDIVDESYATDAGFAAAVSSAPFQMMTSDDYTSQSNALNLDTNRPYDDPGDHFVPTREGTNDLNEDLNIPTRKTTVSYDELRRKNRDDFNNSNRLPSRYVRPPLPPPPPSQPEYGAIDAPTNVPIAAGPPAPVARNPAEYERHPFAENDRRRATLRTKSDNANKNRYGDIWTE